VSKLKETPGSRNLLPLRNVAIINCLGTAGAKEQHAVPDGPRMPLGQQKAGKFDLPG